MALTVPDVTQSIASAIKKETADLAVYWLLHAERGLTFGQQEVLGRLIARGFTQAQAAAWDRYDEFVADLALWKALMLGGMLESFDRSWLDSIDRRKELNRVQVFIDGVYVNPGGGSAAPGQISSGPSVGVGSGSLFNHPPESLTDNQPLEW